MRARDVADALLARVTSAGAVVATGIAAVGLERDGSGLRVRTIAGVPAIVVDPQGYLRTAPHLHGLEMFFGAVLQRQA